MKHIKLTLAAAAALGLVTVSYAQQPLLNEIALTSTGAGTSDFLKPIAAITAPGVNASGLNTSTGLGTIIYTSSATGSQYFGLFLDIDNDVVHSTAWTDEGSASGTPLSGETWEIGDADLSPFSTPPGPPDIYDDAANNTLPDANTITGSPSYPIIYPPHGDVSFGLGFDFGSAIPGTETITITSSLTAPTSGFYLEQDNILDLGTGNDQTNYLFASASFAPSSGGNITAPDGGSTLSAFTLGMMALATLKYRFARK